MLTRIEVVRSAEGEAASTAEPPVQCLDGLSEDLLLQVVKSTDTLSLCDVKVVGKAWCSRARRELCARLADAFELSTLASELQGQGRYHEAEMLSREAVELLREKLGDRHPHPQIICIHKLSVLLKDPGDLWDADPLLREALEGLRQVLGSRHRSTLACIGSLGALKLEKFELVSAEPLYRELVEGMRVTLGSQHLDTLCAISNLGALLREKFCRNSGTDLADLAAAELLYREVLGVQGQTLGAHHPDTITTSTTLASLLAFAGRLGQRTVRPAVKLEQDKQDAFILRQRFDENAISYEFGAKKFVRRAVMELKKMTDDELDHLRLNDPDVFEVFERCGGIIIRARHTGTA